MIEARIAGLEREYGHRRGLIGAHAAEIRFEDGVFAYLVEDYDRAATIFFTLVEAEALVEIYQVTIPNEERRTEAIRQLNVELANNVKFLDAQINFQRKQTDFANNQIGLQE